MDEGKGGQTQSSVNLGRNGKEKKNGISLARAIPSKKVTGRAGEGDRHAPEGA